MLEFLHHKQPGPAGPNTNNISYTFVEFFVMQMYNVNAENKEVNERIKRYDEIK